MSGVIMRLAFLTYIELNHTVLAAEKSKNINQNISNTLGCLSRNLINTWCISLLISLAVSGLFRPLKCYET